MPAITIEGIPGVKNGKYELDMDYWTNDELRRIKQMSKLRPGEFVDAIRNQDNDFVVALAAVALERAGERVVDELLWEARVGQMVLDFSDVEIDETEAKLPPQNALDESASDDASQPLSGDNSRLASATPQENDQSDTGSQHLVTGSVSVHATSGQ